MQDLEGEEGGTHHFEARHLLTKLSQSYVSDLRRRDLPLLYGRDVHQDAGHGHRRQGLLSVRDVEQAGLLHRHGRVGLYDLRF